MPLDLSDEEKRALAKLLGRAIDDHLVPGMPASGRARSDRDGVAAWRTPVLGCSKGRPGSAAVSTSAHGEQDRRPRSSKVAKGTRQRRRFDPVVSRSRMRSPVWLQRAPGSAAVST